MTSPKDRYPNADRRYPDRRGGAPEEGQALEDAIRGLASSRATVLLFGGPATTRAVVARALHDRSSRAGGPFVTVDCAATAPDAFEEVLFGGPSYGAPPDMSLEDAPRSAVGDAERGTLYVAAIEGLPLPVQPRFLRFLDDARTVRVVASSSKDLAAMARKGRFRRDLAERLLLVVVDLSGGG
jgi:DNA-binding NtrC family response regulator